MPELLAKLEQYPIAGCFEDPLPGEDIDGYIELRKRSRLPIVLHHFPMGATYEVLMKPADAYMLGHSRIGDAIRRAGLFAADNSPFMLQNVGGTITRTMTTHMMAAFPTATFHFFADTETWKDDVVKERLEPINGFLRVPEKPGLGLTTRPKRARTTGEPETAGTGEMDYQVAVQERDEDVQHRGSEKLHLHGAAGSEPPHPNELRLTDLHRILGQRWHTGISRDVRTDRAGRDRTRKRLR